ncbi:cystatin-F [Cyclopterus lumpus]|uniref:Cystatin F n=1 Tax=Cyclopterus lumpus TaxID=8103 RepID=A0A8C2YXA2_CYCLU|nr:cystatin-F [Cyclopterus lumpus]
MMGLKTLLLVSLLAARELMLAAGSHHGRPMPGSPINISRKDPVLRQVVLRAACSFNNQSNDAFLFKPSAIHRAQRQVVKGVQYIVDMEISRTVCRKRDDNNNNNNLSTCNFQPEGRLQQTFQCHTEVWVIPWKNETRTLVLDCKP